MIKWNTGMQIMRPQSMVRLSNLDEMDLAGYDSAVKELSAEKRKALMTMTTAGMSVDDAIDLFVALPKTRVTYESNPAPFDGNSMKGSCVVYTDDARHDLHDMVQALGRMVDFSVTERHNRNSYTGDDMGPQIILEWKTNDGSLMQAIHSQMEDEKLQREIEKVQEKKRQVALTDANNAKIQAARVLAERTAQYEAEAMF